MDAFVVDPRQAASMAADAAAQQDFVLRRQKIDIMRKGLGSTKTEAEELRDTCEGFEAIFLQKMWEQMRKTVPKEGYLHSKDEEMYQSMFDVELCKKMTTAGGIGLADMLYEQLSQKLVDTGRTTSPGGARAPVVAPSSTEYLAQKKLENQNNEALTHALDTDRLYSELPATHVGPAEAQPAPVQDPVGTALEELRLASAATPLVNGPLDTREEAARPLSKAEAENLMDSSWVKTQPISATPRPVNTIMGARKERESRAEAARQNSGIQAPTPGAGDVPARSLPTSQITITAHSKPEPATPATPVAVQTEEESLPSILNPFAPLGQLLPDNASWPIIGNISSAFGWQTNKATGNREWNQGVTIETPPGSRVTAAMPGTVSYNGPARGYDNLVILDHGDSLRSYYGNARTNGVNVGDHVDAGMVFASTKSGTSPGENGENIAPLFFALKKGEIALNPEAVLPKESFIGYRLL